MLLCGLTDKDLVEYVGANMSIQVPLLVINRKLSTCVNTYAKQNVPSMPLLD